jgi:hypothetical protein
MLPIALSLSLLLASPVAFSQDTQETPMERTQKLIDEYFRQQKERQDKYNKMLDGWMGHDIAYLVKKWGAPTTDFRSPDGSRLLMFRETRTAPLGGHLMQCETTFTAVGDKLTHWRWKGNDCQ